MSMTDLTFTRLASDIPGAEGPLVTRDGGIFFVAPGPGEIRELLADGIQRVHANTGGTPAGLQLDRNGDIWVADMKRGVLRVTPDGTVHDEVTEYAGKPIRGCNDLIFDSFGNLYITAPAGSNGKPDGNVGEIFFRSTTGEVRQLDSGFAFPNGIAVSADCKLLVFAETLTRKLIAYDLAEPGIVSNRRTWVTLPGEGASLGGDGMDFDAAGNLVSTNYSPGTLEVFDRDARPVRTITLPFKKCSNVHFLNDGSGRLLVTEHENFALWSFPYGSAGQEQYGWT